MILASYGRWLQAVVFSEVCVQHLVAPCPDKGEATRLTTPARADHNMWAGCIDIRLAGYHALG